jgi:hypothetical protein
MAPSIFRLPLNFPLLPISAFFRTDLRSVASSVGECFGLLASADLELAGKVEVERD